jgi:hypothetical protein
MSQRRIGWVVLWVALAVLVTAVVLFVFIPKYGNLRELQRVRMGLEAENQRIRGETAALRRRQERFGADPGFVERTGHESGRIKTNETVFLFPPEP